MNTTESVSPFQLVWALYRYGLWNKAQLTEWIYAQLANDPDNPLWCHLVFYEPDIYSTLYPEAFPELLFFNLREIFCLRLVEVDLSSQVSIDQFNTWLMANYYHLDYEDVHSPESQYLYHLEHFLECETPVAQIQQWVTQQLSDLMSMAQQVVAVLMAPLH